MSEKLALLCQILKAHSVRLVYTPDDHAAWKPWQVIATYQDDSEQFFKIRKTAEEAMDQAIEQAQSDPPTRLRIPKSWRDL